MAEAHGGDMLCFEEYSPQRGTFHLTGKDWGLTEATTYAACLSCFQLVSSFSLWFKHELSLSYHH